MWSICGIHDQGFKEREVFGKIRFMVDYSLARKYDIKTYCAKYRPNSKVSAGITKYLQTPNKSKSEENETTVKSSNKSERKDTNKDDKKVKTDSSADKKRTHKDESNEKSKKKKKKV